MSIHCLCCVLELLVLGRQRLAASDAKHARCAPLQVL
jgi:hypothetical protein